MKLLANPKCCATLSESNWNSINAVAFTPDGASLVSVSNGADLKIWDVNSQQCTATLQGHGDRGPSNADGKIYDWAYYVNHLAVRGQQAASGGNDCTVRLWDLESRTLTATCVGHTDAVFCVAISSDGTVASGSRDDTIRLWDATGAHKATLEGHLCVFCVAFNPEGTLLASGGGDEDRTLRLWNTSTYECTTIIRSFKHTVGNVVWSNDGAHLITESGDDVLKVFDASTGACLRTMRNNSICGGLTLTPCGTYVVAGDKSDVKFWDWGGKRSAIYEWTVGLVTGGRCVKTLKALSKKDCMVKRLAVSPDGRTLAAPTGDKIRIWDIAEREWPNTD